MTANDEKKEFFNEDIEFQNLVKRAKRKTILRNVIITCVISPVLLFTLYFVGAWTMKNKIEKESHYDGAWNAIQGANIQSNGTVYNYQFLSSTSTEDLVKKIGNVPIPWGKREKQYTFLGTSKLIVSLGASGSGSINDERIYLYENGERAMEFFHPSIPFKNLYDDRNVLEEMNDNKLVEFAFSFDRAYSIQEVNKMFNKSDLAWYWVDTFSKEDIQQYKKDMKETQNDQTVSGDGAYGFAYNENDEGIGFIQSLEIAKKEGMYKETAQEIYDSLTNNEKVKLTSDKLKIIGVVVTGESKELKKYINFPFIRAATLGATTDKY
ncbi:anti sigma factor C-terminal domain-containing protein [Metabacillus fastidiosus]|uniref:Anti sigma factor C-terminal domain-containing protein n=1 Tax=Metabacillus fastidiosus TaxID=1458 RepID=A0ABU6NY70_9BACI|nr:anti sigma factor C-terminal domain-containing protein [Metabacillus fastidiosus]